MIESMWKEDSKLDDEKLDHDSLAIPRKHAKYLQLLNQVTMLRDEHELCLLYTSPSPRDLSTSRMPSSA